LRPAPHGLISREGEKGAGQWPGKLQLVRLRLAAHGSGERTYDAPLYL
jgi:hypothetical protein